jgi:4-amino-4-deoxy-L-arabinose transferase-like glycosyltransferase
MALARRFDGLYGQDAYAYFDYAMGSLRQSILHLHLTPLEPFFWPPGYPLLVALVSLAVGPLPLAGQAVSLTMGAAVAVFTALLVQELSPERSGSPRLAILAGLLVALCGQLWQSSVVVMADTTGLALATLAAWALVRYANTRCRLRWLLVASAALAYATLARWIYGLVAVPLAAYAVYAMARRGALVHGVFAVLLGGAILLPVLGAPLLGLLSNPTEPAPFAGNLQVYSWSPLNMLRSDFPDTPDGHLSYVLANGVYYAIAPGNLAFFGPVLAPFALLGAWIGWRSWRRPTFLLVVGWAACVYAFHAGAPWQNFRFTLAYLPPLAILAATGLDGIWLKFADGRSRTFTSALAVLGLLTMALGGVRLVQGFIDRKDEELAIVRWVESQTSPGARLLSFGPTLALRHYSQLATVDLFDVSPVDLSSLAATAEPLFVLVDEKSIAQQWADRAPGANLAALRSDPGLVHIGVHGNYTLFRITDLR